MANHCPDKVIVGDETCTKFDEFKDEYFGGCVKFEVCLYRCSGGKVHARARMYVCGVAIGETLEQTIDTGAQQQGTRACPQNVQASGQQCRLSAEYDFEFVPGVRVHVCAYTCGDQAFILGRWRVSFFGIPCREREHRSFPFPV